MLIKHVLMVSLGFCVSVCHFLALKRHVLDKTAIMGHDVTFSHVCIVGNKMGLIHKFGTAILFTT